MTKANGCITVSYTHLVELALKDSYYNMLDQIRPCMHLIDNAKKACEAAGVQWFEEATRGGTDGARLSYCLLYTSRCV